MEDNIQQLNINVQNPISIWIYKGERYFTQLCVVSIPREKVLEYLLEVHDIRARFCTDLETTGFFGNTPGTFINTDQVCIRII